MDRRHFIKQTLLGTGLLTAAPSLAFDRWQKLAAEPSSESLSSCASSAIAPSDLVGLHKSIMWAVVHLEGSLLEKCKIIKAAGFEGIEPLSHMNRAEMLAAMQATGLKASSVCGAKHWEFPLSSSDAKIRTKGIDALYHTLEDAEAYGTDTVLLVPGVVNADTSYEQCWERSRAALREVIPSAEKAGIRIGIENVWNNFLLSAPEMIRYIDQFDSAAVGAYFDVGNVTAFGWAHQWIESLKGRIVRLHMKDFSRTLCDQQGRYKGFEVALGDGDNDWPRIMEAIHHAYPNGWFTIEHTGGSSSEGLQTLSSRWDRIVKS